MTTEHDSANQKIVKHLLNNEKLSDDKGDALTTYVSLLNKDKCSVCNNNDNNTYEDIIRRHYAIDESNSDIFKNIIKPSLMMFLLIA